MKELKGMVSICVLIGVALLYNAGCCSVHTAVVLSKASTGAASSERMLIVFHPQVCWQCL